MQADADIRPGVWQGLRVTGPDVEEPLAIVICPLGDACLGDGPACFAAADALAAETSSHEPTET